MIALWIDVEGAAYDVLVGIEDIRDRVALIHVEVEGREIWEDQKLEPNVRRLMEGWGFREIARGASAIQHDSVYLNDHARAASPLLIHIAVAAAAVLSVVARWPIAARVLKALGSLVPTWRR